MATPPPSPLVEEVSAVSFLMETAIVISDEEEPTVEKINLNDQPLQVPPIATIETLESEKEKGEEEVSAVSFPMETAIVISDEEETTVEKMNLNYQPLQVPPITTIKTLESKKEEENDSAVSFPMETAIVISDEEGTTVEKMNQPLQVPPIATIESMDISSDDDDNAMPLRGQTVEGMEKEN